MQSKDEQYTSECWCNKEQKTCGVFHSDCCLPSRIIIELLSVALMASETFSLLSGTWWSRSLGMLGATCGETESQTSEL